MEVKLKDGSVALIDTDDAGLVMAHKWYLDRRRGYAMTSINGRIVLMHRLVLGAKPGEFTDHVHGNRLDNRRSELRIVTQRQNNQNKRPTSRSGYKGVTWDKYANRWKAAIQVNRKSIHLGRFDTSLDAASAYNAAAAMYFGEYAWLNDLAG